SHPGHRTPAAGRAASCRNPSVGRQLHLNEPRVLLLHSCGTTPDASAPARFREVPVPAVTLEVMCGIVGYVGPAEPGPRPLEVVMEGLGRLEYRGYDSAGVAVATREGLASAKKAGKLANLIAELDSRPIPDGTAAIGHTRWATHGGPTDTNAHPHLA